MDVPLLLFLLTVPVGLLALALLGRSSKAKLDYPYVAAPGLLTPAERQFLRVLEAALPECRVFAKVRVADLIRVQPGLPRKAWRGAFNRVAMKHVDFVLCRPADLAVVCAVELDDRSHERRDRRARDAFLEHAFAAAGIPLVRVGVKNRYEPAELRELMGGLEVPKAA